jgi:DNA-binding CsgD family transcriptional regulator
MIQAILAIGRPSFAAAVRDAVRECMSVDEATVLAFPDKGDPRLLFSASPRSEGAMKVLIQKGAEQYYSEDVDIRSIMAWNDPKGALIIHRTAREFTRRNFFDDVRTADKLLLVKVIDGLRVVMTIYGKPTTHTADYIPKIERLAPVILSAIVRDHSLRHDDSVEATTDIGATVRRLELVRGVEFTRREAQVCAGIMEGRSTTAIALNLGIAPSSVITFRKNLYRKLGIVSQAELFSLGLAARAAPSGVGPMVAGRLDGNLRQANVA